MLDTIDINKIKQLALNAGSAILEIYKKDFIIDYKDDKSPLTEADIKSNEIICTVLKELYPSIPILSEENKEIPYDERKDWEYYWCIDPIDGTKEFIKKNGEFTVNIALIHDNTPVLGVVYAPVLDKMYFAKKGEGAYEEGLRAQSSELRRKRLPLHVKENYAKSISVVASKSHMSDETKAFVDGLAPHTSHLALTSKGSSLKLCMIATGEADIYPRIAPTMEWDTAAAHAVCLEAGKNVFIYDKNVKATDYLLLTTNLSSLMYNKRNLLNPFFVVV